MTRFVFGLAAVAALPLVAGNDCRAQQAAQVPVALQRQAVIGADSVVAHPPKRKDTFLGPDKVKHFFMSAFIESVGFAGMEAAGASRSASIGTATAVTAAAGIGREVHDKITKNLFSFGDLTWDAIGTGAALLLISHTER